MNRETNDLAPTSMHRVNQVVFVVSLLGLCWLGMMALHELGHVIGALLTRGNVEAVVLHPFSISRTDVYPNPSPGIVVWMGPIVGALLPLGLIPLVRRDIVLKNVAVFFAGFCLIANGAYVSIGSIDKVGDCGVMLRTGTPYWLMYLFGLAAIVPGSYLWHRLGTVKAFIGQPQLISRQMAGVAFGVLVVIVVAELALSPM